MSSFFLKKGIRNWRQVSVLSVTGKSEETVIYNSINRSLGRSGYIGEESTLLLQGKSYLINLLDFFEGVSTGPGKD